MANSIFGYSDGYINNPYYFQGGQTTYKIFEPKTPFPEKAGDNAIERVTLIVPVTNLAGTATVATDFGYVIPLPNNIRVTALDMDITTAATAGGAYTVNVGNNTSATAYLSAISIVSTGVSTATRASLDAASPGVGANDAVVVKIASATTPSAAATIVFTISYAPLP